MTSILSSLLNVTHEKNRGEYSVLEGFESAAFVALFVFMIITSIVGNISAFYVVLQDANQSMDKSSRVLIALLAASDMGLAITIIPLRIMEFLRSSFSLGLCLWYIVGDVFFSTSIILTLLAMAINCFIKVQFPFTYEEKVTSGNVIFVSITIWIYSLFCGILSPLGWNDSFKLAIKNSGGTCRFSNSSYMMVISTFNFCIPLIITFLIYIYLSTSLMMQHRKCIENVRYRHKERELKTAFTFMVIYVTFLICWLPNFSMVYLYQLRAESLEVFVQEHPRLFRHLYNLFVVVLPPINSVCDPILYGLHHATFKKSWNRGARKARGSSALSYVRKARGSTVLTYVE